MRFARGLSDIAAFCERGDAIGGAEGEGLDGHGGLAAAGGYEAAAIAEEKILYVVRAVVGVDHRGLGIIAHAAGAEEMDGELLLANGGRPLLLGSGGVEEFEGALAEPVGKLDVVGMIFVSEAKSGQAPGIFQVGIEREAVGLDGQGSAVAE